MTILDKLDLTLRLDREQYTKRLEEEQRRLLQLRLHLGGELGDHGVGPGLLVLFPGTTRHRVEPYRGQRPRVVIAANGKLVSAR